MRRILIVILVSILALLLLLRQDDVNEEIIWLNRIEFEILMIRLASVPKWEKIPSAHLRPLVTWDQVFVPFHRPTYSIYLDVIASRGLSNSGD